MAAHIRDRVPAESPDRDHDHHCDQSGHRYPADKRPEDGKQEEQEGARREGRKPSAASRGDVDDRLADHRARSEEHTSELQSLMRISYAVFCLKKKKTRTNNN